MTHGVWYRPAYGRLQGIVNVAGYGQAVKVMLIHVEENDKPLSHYNGYWELPLEGVPAEGIRGVWERACGERLTFWGPSGKAICWVTDGKLTQDTRFLNQYWVGTDFNPNVNPIDAQNRTVLAMQRFYSFLIGGPSAIG